MKKDMGGAANVLGLAQMIMAAKLPVRLRVLIPAVENAIAGNAFRPGDVWRSRKGLTVEIGNTDAEGRLILGDALALADEETPDLLIDMATLTGAARVALGPDLPPFYTDDDATGRSPRQGRAWPRTIRLAHALLAALQPALRVGRRRHQQCRRVRLCRVDHGGPVPPALRGAGAGLTCPFRHLRLDPAGPARPPAAAAKPRRMRALFARDPEPVRESSLRPDRIRANLIRTRNNPLRRRVSCQLRSQYGAGPETLARRGPRHGAGR